MSTKTFPYLSIGPFQEIISGISTVFSFSDGVVKLTGAEGTGKSSLLLELVKDLRGESFEVVDFKIPPKSVEELQSTLIRKFKLGADLSFRKSLIRYLSTKPRDLQKLILVIDDAHLMSVEALAGLHGLRDLENNGQPLISLLLCGDKSLNALLGQPELSTLQADISLNYSINALEDGELSEFCTAYLQQVGKGRIALDQAFLDKLLEITRGLPGQILTELETGLADPAFLLDHKQAELPPEPVEAEPAMLEQVIHSISTQIQNIPPETKRWLKPTAGVLFAAAAASTVYVYLPSVLLLYGEYRGTPPSAASQPAQVAATTPTQPPAAAAPAAAPVPQPQVAQPAVPTPAVAVNNQPVVQAAPPTPAVTPAAAPVRPTQSAPAPAIAASAVPALPVVAASATDLETVVNRWLAAWQQQDADQYLGFYHTDFASLYHDSRNSWREDRVRSVKKPSRIELKLSELEVAGTDATGTTVRFRLNYQSPTYADRTLKELVLGRDEDGQLRILREMNVEVELQPGGRIAAAPAAGAQPQSPAAASVASVTRIGEPMVIQPDAELAPLQNNRDNINQFISSWLNSWQHKDLDGYFSHYQPQFKAPAMASADEWRDDRKVKIIRPAVIQLQLENMELLNDSGEETVLQLTLAYHSSYYADRTQKELHLQRQSDGSLQITEEKNLAVETLPLARLLPSNTVAMLELVRSIVANQL